MSYEEIEKKYGLIPEGARSTVAYLTRKTGARSTAELALMVRLYEPDNVRSIYHNQRPREERLFEALGLDAVPLEEVRPLLEYATPEQIPLLEAYYFSPQQLSWRGIAEQFGISRPAAIQIAGRGVAKIRAHLQAQQQEAAA